MNLLILQRRNQDAGKLHDLSKDTQGIKVKGQFMGKARNPCAVVVSENEASLLTIC